jgi:uncharacterized Zn finger protein (UPF0148 family)
MWARAVAPFAEWVAGQLWTRRRPSPETGPATRLTQSRKREAKGITSAPKPKPVARPHSICRTCGKSIVTGRLYCAACAVPVATQHIKEAAQAARDRAHSPESRAKQARTQSRLRKAQVEWSVSSQPRWLTEKFYTEKIQPALASVSNSAIASRLGVSRCSGSRIRSGKLRPHSRHWLALAELVGCKQQLEIGRP